MFISGIQEGEPGVYYVRREEVHFRHERCLTSSLHMQIYSPIGYHIVADLDKHSALQCLPED